MHFILGKQWFMMMILHGVTDLLNAVEHIRFVISALKENYISLPRGMYIF